MSPVSRCNRRGRVLSPAARRTSECAVAWCAMERLAGRLFVAFLLLVATHSTVAAAAVPDDGPAGPVRANQGVTWSSFAPFELGHADALKHQRDRVVNRWTWMQRVTFTR